MHWEYDRTYEPVSMYRFIQIFKNQLNGNFKLDENLLKAMKQKFNDKVTDIRKQLFESISCKDYTYMDKLLMLEEKIVHEAHNSAWRNLNVLHTDIKLLSNLIKN